MRLGKGINYSRYCWQWRGNKSIDYNDYLQPADYPELISPLRLTEAKKHFKLIKNLGFDTVRLPITFHCWSRFDTDAIDPNHSYWAVLDNAIESCTAYGLKLVISYHHAPTIWPQRVLTQWLQVAQRDKVRTSPVDRVLFEIFNEPTKDVSNDVFRNHAIDIINALRAIPDHQNRWMVIGGNDYNDIGYSNVGLTNLVPLGLSNLIYTFHSYEPKVFTNQGFKSEKCFNTFPISYPYVPNTVLPPFIDECVDEKGNHSYEGTFKYNNYAEDRGNRTGVGMGILAFVGIRLQEALNWSVANGNLPLWCGEWGCHHSMPPMPNDGSFENFVGNMVTQMKTRDIDWCWWDFEGGFTIFDPAPAVHLSDNPFGQVNAINDHINPSLRRLMSLNENISWTLTGGGFVPTNRPRQALRASPLTITIYCKGDVSQLATLELTYQKNVLDANELRLGLGVQPIVSINVPSFSHNIRLKAIRRDGSSFEVLPD